MRLRNAPICLFAALAVGCAKPEAQLVGKWTVDPSSLSTGNAQGDSMAKQFAQSMAIEFKADKTFTMTILLSFEGTYEVSGHTVTMKPTKAMGVDLSKLESKDDSKSKPMVATLSDDGKTLSTDQSGKPLKFVKSS
jgi:hypothetical protein